MLSNAQQYSSTHTTQQTDYHDVILHTERILRNRLGAERDKKTRKEDREGKTETNKDRKSKTKREEMCV